MKTIEHAKNKMSHEIKQFDKQQGKQMAWHGLTDVKPELSLENSWLNEWDYAPRKLVLDDGQKTPFMVLGVTDDCREPLFEGATETVETVPLTIGKPYNPKSFRPILNKHLLDKIAKAIDGKGLTLESCGTVMNRGRLFLSFGLQDAKFQAAGREFQAFLNIGNGNDMSSPLWVNTSNVCTVCNNTFCANLSDAGMIMSVKKTQFSEFKLGDMGKAISAMLNGQKAFAKTLGQLAVIECDEKTAREFFAGFVGEFDKPLSTRAENVVEKLVNLFSKGAGNDGNDYSDVFQGLTDYYTHSAASGEDSSEAKWKNFVSSEFGSGKTAKMESWNILTDDKLRKSTVTIGRKVLQLTAKMHREEEKAEQTPA